MAVLPLNGYSQKYNFTHYNVENGLSQSQILKIYQDRDHYLWLGSFGGASRFDGTEFVSINKSDGLPDNVVTAILKDKRGNVWMGTEAGLSCIRGSKVSTYTIPNDADRTWIRSIAEDKNGDILFIRKSKLYIFRSGKIIPSVITGAGEYIVAMSGTASGNIYASVFGKGIFSLQSSKWVQKVRITDSVLVTGIVPDRLKSDKFYLLSPKQIYVAENGGKKPYTHPMLDTVQEPLFSLGQDVHGNLWVGTNNGAYYLRLKDPVHFVTENGFTNNAVTDIYRDFEGNMWLCTDGQGIFKYDGDAFFSYEKFNGKIHSIMGIARDNSKNIWMGSFTDGLIRYDGRNFKTVLIPDNSDAQKINCLYNDPNKGLLIGTVNGLWSYNGAFTNLTKTKGPEIVHSVITDQSGTIWMASPTGCFYLDKRDPVKVTGADYSSTALLEAGKDSILTGTNHGIFLIKGKRYRDFSIKPLENSSILCLLKYKNTVLAGTFGDGLYIIDPRTRRSKKIDVKNGLYSNDIYSLTMDGRGQVWAGGGRGVNRIAVDVNKLELSVLNDVSAPALIECNQNSILSAGGKVWVGSTKGLYIYNASGDLHNSKPYINIESVRVFGQARVNGKLPAVRLFRTGVAQPLQLKSSDNRIVISFRGIYFTNPTDVAYQYRLKGLDSDFSQPIKRDMIEYPSLLPGSYTFEVKAVAGGQVSNIRSFSFEITPPFYQTILFRVSMMIVLIGSIVGVQYYITSARARQQKLLAAIKHEEQLKIRQQTAEDFHDDIGNKLTRISILSDMLNKKVGEESEDQRRLISQIKENAATLYSGAKDILWALDPQSDNLYEVLEHIKEYGTDLFSDSDVDFHFAPIDKKYRGRPLPMEYSRNISMIFRELLGNIFKHAEARNVYVEVGRPNGSVEICLRDDGKGYDTEANNRGRGLGNIRLRAQRINSAVKFSSEPGKGSKTILTINLDPSRYA
ncbi:MAG: hypothetical protein K0S09_1167 [Sphingobacteriaceae bacterium]|nr:hypothetical protein [Sphingobacteriaceae bacterium]